MAVTYPDLENIQRLKVPPTSGEWNLINYLKDHLDDTYEVFFNPYLDGDRPDIIILKEHCSAFIIEVKDWNLKNFSIAENNKWTVFDGSKSSTKASPQSQVFRYKKNLYDLHLPVIGLARITNPNFYNLVHCFVYFHNSEKKVIDSLYSPGEEKLKEEQSRLNQKFKEQLIAFDSYEKKIAFDSYEKKIAFDSYEKKSDYLSRKKRNLQRDRNMSFGDDRLAHLVKKIKQNSIHSLFDESVYRDFKRRCSGQLILDIR